MLVLMCTIGSERLAIPAALVAEVLPRIELHTLMAGPGWLAGYFDYRGRPTPVVNFGAAPDTIRLSHRIVLMSLPLEDRTELIGLAVDDATTQTLELSFQKAGAPQSRWGSLQLDDAGMFHLMEPSALLGRLVKNGLLLAPEGVE